MIQRQLHRTHVLLSAFPSVLCLAGLCLSAPRARAEVAYENITSAYDQFWGRAAEFGDEIELGGSGRTVTRFECEYYGFMVPNGTQSATVRFYANDGEGSDLITGTFGQPGTMLYESAPVRLVSGYNVITLRNLAVNVPSRFTWTIQFNGLAFTAIDSAGLTLFDPPTQGSSYNDFWQRTTNGWQILHFYNDRPVANFAARVETAPDTTATVSAQGPLADGAYAVTLLGPAYRSALLETSADGQRWSALRPVVLTGEPFSFMDIAAKGATNRQYRLRYVTDAVLDMSVSMGTNGATLELVGTPGKVALIESSSDLTHWSIASTNYLTSAWATYQDMSATTRTNRFYRANLDAEMFIRTSSVKTLSNGKTLVVFHGPAGLDCQIQSSTNSTTWNLEEVRTFSFSGGEINFLDGAAAAGVTKYYRGVLQP